MSHSLQTERLMDEGNSVSPELSGKNCAKDEESPSYGWLGCRPRSLQSCLSTRWILFFCCLLVFTQGFIVTGLSGVVITSIEKRYFLRSSQVGSIFACYDIGNTILTLVVSYFGHRHKPKWLGLGSIVLGFGCLIFALPQILVGAYEPAVAVTTDMCQNNLTLLAASNDREANCKSSEWYHLLVFVVGQLLIGAGASPVYNVGSAYLDENASHKNSGVYLGIYYAVSTLGPGLGFLLGGYFLTIYVDISLPDGITLKQDDNSWIGAWWLGYLFGGICALLSSIPLLGFPREIPYVKSLNDQKRKAQDSVLDEEKPHNTSHFLPALKSLFTNKVFLFTTIAGTAEGFAVAGTSTFFPKFLESQFHLSSSNASFRAGVVIVPGGFLGMLLGGFLIRKFQWTCHQCLRACTIIAFVAVFPILIFLVHCPNENIAGVTTPYFNRTTYLSLDACSTNQNCSCKQSNYVPVCTKEDHTTYFSPCYAGCKNKTEQGGEVVYTNCSCLPPNITVAYDGGCVETCNSIVYFLTVMFVLIGFTFVNNIPALTATLRGPVRAIPHGSSVTTGGNQSTWTKPAMFGRVKLDNTPLNMWPRCVPKSQGSFALGVQQIITRILAFIPAPIIYGALLDSICILSETDPCEEDVNRNCLEYKNKDLSYVFLAATMICKLISVSFFALAWLVYKPPKAKMESQLDLVYSNNGLGTNGSVNNTKTESTAL